jgi:hypothetical protein
MQVKASFAFFDKNSSFFPVFLTNIAELVPFYIAASFLDNLTSIHVTFSLDEKIVKFKMADPRW